MLIIDTKLNSHVIFQHQIGAPKRLIGYQSVTLNDHFDVFIIDPFKRPKLVFTLNPKYVIHE